MTLPPSKNARAPVARLVAAAGMLDLDDVGAERAEDLGGRRPGERARQVEHADAGERGGRPSAASSRHALSARMREVFSSIVDAVSGSNWSYLIVFAVAMIDAFFPIVPSEATAIAAGVVAGAGGLSVELCILAAALGAIAGDNISLRDRPLPRLPRRAAVLLGREVAETPAMGAADARASAAAR